MDIFYLIPWDRSHLFRAESWGLTPHHKAHEHHFISFASLSLIPYNVNVRYLLLCLKIESVLSLKKKKKKGYFSCLLAAVAEMMFGYRK